MKAKINLSAFHPEKAWKMVYQVYTREFLFGSDYEQFAEMVATEFTLTSEQWQQVLDEWEFKERMLSDDGNGEPKGSPDIHPVFDDIFGTLGSILNPLTINK
jgi:hypothetical protein